MRHYLAAIAGALLIVAPALRGLIGFSEFLYVFLAIALFNFAVLSNRNWSVNSWQLSWWFFLFLLFIYLLATSFPFTNYREVLIAGCFLISSLSIGILCSLSWSEKFFHTIAWIIILAGSALSLIVLYGFMKTEGDYRKLFNEDALGYLALGSFISLAFCIALPFVFTDSGKKKLLWLLILFINGLGLITVLSRGALLFSGLVGTLYMIYYWPQRKTIKKVISSLAARLIAMALAGYFVFTLIPARTLSRLQRLFFGDEIQAGGRGEIWAQSLNKILQAPVLGHGLGEASVANIYPHNLFLQVGIDGGITGIILLMIVVSIPLAIFYKAWAQSIIIRDPLPAAFLAAYLWALLEGSKSGDFYKARPLFIIASLLIGYLSLLYRMKRDRAIPMTKELQVKIFQLGDGKE